MPFSIIDDVGINSLDLLFQLIKVRVEAQPPSADIPPPSLPVHLEAGFDDQWGEVGSSSSSDCVWLSNFCPLDCSVLGLMMMTRKEVDQL